VIVAHVAGVPVEEALPAVVTWVGAGLLAVRPWFAARMRRRH
jgi:hypothetical protein